MPISGSRPGPPVSPFDQLRQIKEELASAEAELKALQDELQRFEQELDTLLGPLLDQLSSLDAEVQTLTSQVIDLRESRVFGELRTTYSGPFFAHLPDPTIASETKHTPGWLGGETTLDTVSSPPDPQTELKKLYRRLARQYHPDLARSEAERRHNTEQMMAINQAYAAGDLRTLRTLTGVYAPPGAPERLDSAQPVTEFERVQARVRLVLAQLNQLQRMPIVQLNLEAKLARRQGRSLLSEMANDLRRKLARKKAERDYLKSQLDRASSG